MRITHEWIDVDWAVGKPEGSSSEVKRKTWTNVLEVTHYSGISWKRIYWVLGRTGPKAYCFSNPWNNGETPQSISFENEHEMRRFQEDLRLQEENARASTSTQAPSVR